MKSDLVVGPTQDHDWLRGIYFNIIVSPLNFLAVLRQNLFREHIHFNDYRNLTGIFISMRWKKGEKKLEEKRVDFGKRGVLKINLQFNSFPRTAKIGPNKLAKLYLTAKGGSSEIFCHSVSCTFGLLVAKIAEEKHTKSYLFWPFSLKNIEVGFFKRLILLLSYNWLLAWDGQ